MAKEDKSQNTAAEMFAELFLYAPIGLLYEYKDSMPELVKRGKSQVQLTKLLGQMAANKAKGEAKSSAESVLTDTASFLRTVASRLESLDDARCYTTEKSTSSDTPSDDEDSAKDSTTFPIDNYDTLSARKVIELLSSLKAAELEKVLEYERTNKNRKTVLAEIDRLLAL